MDDLEKDIDKDAALFLKYNYAETKEMCKQFLTLVSAILVFSLTFSDRIFDFKTAVDLSKWLIIIAWVMLLLSIIFCGIGLTWLTIAAGQAVYGRGRTYNSIAQKSYRNIIIAGGCFIIGLVLLIATAIVTLIKFN